MRISFDQSSMPLPADVEERFADELDRITQQIQQGETPDVSQLVADYPEMAETIHAYVRQIELLQGAGGEDSNSNLLGLSGDNSKDASLKEIDDVDDENGIKADKWLRVGDYQIDHEIGRGGMGIVYAARQISLDRPVALKILPFASSLDKMQIVRFRNEARAAGQLHHPNIVPVFAVGCEEEIHFYAMQQIIGESLDAVIRRQRGLDPGTHTNPTWLDTSPDEKASIANTPAKDDCLPHSESDKSFDPDATAALPKHRLLDPKRSDKPTPEKKDKSKSSSKTRKSNDSGTASSSDTPFEFSESTSLTYHRQIVKIGIQVAEALQYAHECGIIHRDIKPSNLLIDQAGKIWVTDFGLARIQSDVSVTRTGDVIGTLRYMSPEQASGDAAVLDQRTDVYSLGITLYELVTLHEAFHGIDRRDLLNAIAEKDPVLPRRLNSSIPIDLETIVLKAISKKPEQRYASAQELADDLQRFLDGRPTLARRPTTTERIAKWAGRHRAAVRVAMVLIVVAMIGFGITSLMVTSAHNRAVDANRQLSKANTKLYTTNSELNKANTELGRTYGKLKKANINLGAALEKSETNWRLAEENKDRAEVNYQDARKVVDLGSLYAKMLKRVDGAEDIRQKLLVDTLKYYDKFIKRSESDPELSRDLILTHSRIGSINDQIGDQSKSIDSYQKARGLLEKLITKEPEVLQHQADLALCLNNLGHIYDRAGKTTVARQYFTNALKVLENLSKKYPDNESYLASLAMVNHNLGRLNLRIGDLVKARSDLEKACRFQELAIEQNPKDENYADRLAAIYGTLSRICQETDRTTAIRSCQKAIEIQKRLNDKNPNRRELQSSLALSYHNLGILQKAAGQYDEATASYGEAIKLLSKLVKRSPAVVEYRARLAASENSLGTLYFERRQYAEAGKAYDEARKTLTRLVRDYPNDPSYYSYLGGTLNNIGLILAKYDRHKEAAQTYYEAIKHQKKAHKLAPKVGHYRNFLSNHYKNYARTLRELKHYDEAYQVILARKYLWKGRSDKLLSIVGEMAILIKSFNLRFPDPTPEQSAIYKRMSDSIIETLHETLDAGVLTPEILQATVFDSLRKDPRFRMLTDKLKRG